MAEAGDKKAKMLLGLLNEPSRFLATIQIGITLAGFMASAFAAERFAGRFSQFLFDMGVPVPEQWLRSLSLILITLVLLISPLCLANWFPNGWPCKKQSRSPFLWLDR